MSFVLNPETNRMIKIGTKKWRELIRRGMIDNGPIDKPRSKDPVLLHEGKSEDEAKTVRNAFNKTKIGMKKNTTARRKGNNVYEWSKTPHQEDIAEYTAKAASRTLHKNMDSLSSQLEEAYDNDSDDELGDFEYKLKNLILQEMISPDVKKKPDKTMRIMKSKRKNNVFRSEPDEVDTEYEVDENYSGDDY